MVRVTSKTGLTHSAPSLGINRDTSRDKKHLCHKKNIQVLCPGPWASEMLAKIGVTLPLIPWKIPVYYWRVSQFLPHTFIYDSGTSRAGHVWGLPEQEYPGLVKVTVLGETH